MSEEEKKKVNIATLIVNIIITIGNVLLQFFKGGM